METIEYLGKQFENIGELHEYIIENKEAIIATKKMQIKQSDTFCYLNATEQSVNKEEPKNNGVLKIKAVINTTNLYDSHGDVHIPNIWKKSLSEKKSIYLLQEHEAKFESVISRKVKAFTENYTWKELGYKYEGTTQALVFDAEISSDDNPYMFTQYRKGYVTNHSVGMIYVNYLICINSEEKYCQEEKKNWDKYIGEVANPNDIKWGVFFAVTEAKLIEGSAVLFGSNYATPTLEVQEIKEDNIINEPLKDTHKGEPIAITLCDNLILALKK